MDPRPHRTGRRTVAAGSLAALLWVAACSGSGAPAGTGASTGPSASLAQEGAAGEPAGDEAAALALRTRVTRVAGPLSDERRERVGRQARAVVAAYLEGAFAAGDRPYRAFLPGLRRSARADAAVLRGEAGPVRATAWFAVAAPHGRAVGVTARLHVELPAGAEPASTLTGRLVLTREDGQWQVLGYDLARGER